MKYAINLKLKEENPVKLETQESVSIAAPTYHRDLLGLDYESSGHIGFASSDNIAAIIDGTQKVGLAGKADGLSRIAGVGVGSTGNVGWYKVGQVTAADIIAQANNIATTSYSLIFLVNGTHSIGTTVENQPSGLLEIDARCVNGVFSSTAGYTLPKILGGGLLENEFCVTLSEDGGTLTLYKKFPYIYQSAQFIVLNEQYGSFTVNAFTYGTEFVGEEMPTGGILGVNVNYAQYSLQGDVTGQSVQNSSGNYLTTELTETGVEEGTYTAVEVDAKGRVLQGAQVVEIGTEGQEMPSDLLVVGGLFFKEIS